jgi:amidophosphoribosyltransferase
MFDKPKEYCGVVGVYGHPEASTITYLGLHALQHRGQESAGVVSSDGTQLYRHRGMGLVADLFTPDVLEGLVGDRAIGHVRYSTAGQSVVENAQPFMIKEQGRWLSIAHNGNLVNADELRDELEKNGSIMASTTDTEVILHLIVREKDAAIEKRIAKALQYVEGAYSLVFMTPEKVIAVRDPHGFRPLVLGKLRNNGAWIVASETCAFNLVDAEYVREIAPGEIVIIDHNGLRSEYMTPAPKGGRCVFELIYFARPDSKVFDRSVYGVRRELGRQLARHQPAKVDVAIPVPDSGVAGALGFAEQMGVPFELGLIRSHYVGRTFIEPSQSIRNFGVKLKLSVVREIVEGKSVAVIDDSLVRGTTSRKIVGMLRAAGAKEVHLRITAPPTKFPCYYGIDTPHQEELLASNHSIQEIADYVTADSVGYLSIEQMHEAAKSQRNDFCDACFSGDYRIPVGEARKQLVQLKAAGAR